MQNWVKEQNLYMIIAVVAMIIITCFIFYEIVSRDKKRRDKYMNVVYPLNNISEEITSYDDKKKKKKNKKKKESFFERKGWNKKFEGWYVRAGRKEKTSKDFIYDSIKFFVLGVTLFLSLQYTVGNLLISGMVGLVIIFFPPLKLFSDIKARETRFRNDFPYFLQTVAFVLKNGTNFSSAFYEVTMKQEDTVLKEVMLDVITLQNINAGDYKIAFSSMLDKVKIEEVSEFVSVVIDNLEKGVSVADVFLNQAHGMSKILNLSIKKKISAVSTKILFPILMLIMAIGIMLLNL